MVKKNFINVKLPKKPWLRGGVIGAGICILLFLFYFFAYFPVIENNYLDRSSGTLPAWATALPTFTGHLIFAFLVEPMGYSLSKQVCTTNPVCNNWVHADLAPDCIVPWKEEGIDGCCFSPDTAPAEPCGRYVRNITSLSLILLLVGIYFLIGAGIGWFLSRRKKR